jgi:hypothetical protein
LVALRACSVKRELALDDDDDDGDTGDEEEEET